MGVTSRSWLLLVLTALVVLPARWLFAENWPEFRGPTGQGHATTRGLPLRWGPERHVTWKKPVSGKGWSSPIVYDGLIFLTTAVSAAEDGDRQAAQSLRTLCMDAALGELLWDVEVFALEASETARVHSKNSHASPTPITDGERVYVHFGPHGTAALDFAGNISWRQRPFQYDPVHGSGSSPILSGGYLIVNCDGGDRAFVAALDRHTGNTVWTTPRPRAESQRFSFATPLEIEVAGGRQVVSPGSHAVCSYAPTTGDEIWRVRYPNKWSVVPRPVFAHGLVFICTGYEGPAALLAIRPDGMGDVTETHVVWEENESIPYNPSLLVVDDMLFMVSDRGIASARRVQTGGLLWRKRLGGNYSASPLHADGAIYFVSEEGECTVIEAADEYREVARNDLEERTLASFATADGALFVRTEKHLFRIDASPGAAGTGVK